MMTFLMGLKSISPKALNELRQIGTVAIFDANSRQRWEASRIPGARNVDPKLLREADLPGEKSTPLVFYCSNPWCRKGPIGARSALNMGYTNVRVLSDGIEGWESARLPTERGPIPAHPPA